jgi:hypothetical protein
LVKYLKKLKVKTKYVVLNSTHIMPSISKSASKAPKKIQMLLPTNVSNYDGAGKFLKFVYKKIKPRTNAW